MCGIAGIIQTRSEQPPPLASIVSAMTERLAHRGPDEGSVHAEAQVALGHRRLSIIDLAGGHQPLFNEDGSVVVVFNGEIYNFAEITDELVAAGHVFRTRSDTEVIVHAWEQWGEECLERFRGMFAFVLWDRRQRTAFLARDRLGVKPLYWALLPDGQLLFGSELKALEAHPNLPRRLSPQAVEQFLALGYVPEPETIWASVHKLPAASCLRVRVGQPVGEPRTWWHLNHGGATVSRMDDALDELGALIEESVRLRMVSDVPVGAFLSGGVDSSLVVATMSAHVTQPVTTFSIGFNSRAHDESVYARRIAQRFGTDHVERQVDRDDASIIDRVLDAYDEPFADASAIATWRVCELARTRVKVALSGDGGDEAFGGYRRYRLHLAEERVRRAVPAAVRRALFGPLARLYPKGDWLPQMLRAKTTLAALADTAVDAYARSVQACTPALRRALYTPNLRSQLGDYDAIEVHRHAARSFAGERPLDLLQHLDLKTWLSGDINTKVDRTSMAHSLEVRDPLLDHRLFELAARLAQPLRTTPTQGKVVLRAWSRRHLPADIIDRPKQGFSEPVGQWLKGPLGDSLLGRVRNNPAVADLLEPRQVATMLGEHRSGRVNHERSLWAVLALTRFLERTSGSPLHA